MAGGRRGGEGGPFRLAEGTDGDGDDVMDASDMF